MVWVVDNIVVVFIRCLYSLLFVFFLGIFTSTDVNIDEARASMSTRLNVQRIRKRKYFECIVCTRLKKINTMKLNGQKQQALTMHVGVAIGRIVKPSYAFCYSFRSIFTRKMFSEFFFLLTCCCRLLLFFPLIRNTLECLSIVAIQTQF